MSELDPQQRAAVDAPRGPVCVLAGAGTGKTRTITHRIASLTQRGLVAPGQILAVSFTTRAAGELRGRLTSLGVQGVQARTFHSAALRQLQYFWPRVVGDLPWRVLDKKFALVSQACARCGVATTTETIRDVMGEIEWAKGSLVGAVDYPAAIAAARRSSPIDAAKLSEVYRCYDELKASGEVMLLDFDDLLLHTAAALSDHAVVADEFRDRYRSFVVDEYQDVTPLQQQVLDAWVGDRDDLTVVGDANQTIYSFAAATPQYLLGFSKRFPDATLVRLERDYRSTPEVVEVANRVIGAARGRVAGSRLELVGQRPRGPAPEFVEFASEPEEAQGVAKKIAGLIANGIEPSSIAVLYRINAQSQSYEQALDEAQIPFQVRGGASFYERTEIRQALKAFGLAVDAAGSASGEDLIAVVRRVLEPLGLSDAEPAGAQARERWDSLTVLVDVVADVITTQPQSTMASLVLELRQRAEHHHVPVDAGVTLASFHAAKGLEWDAVFLVGLTDGMLPISHALANDAPVDAVEEERRLLYVGVTRARSYLTLSWALARSEGGRRSRKPSRFLDGIVPARTSGNSQVGAGGSCRVCGNRLVDAASRKAGRCSSCPSDINADLFAELKKWRLEAAQDRDVPAFVVFTDSTLAAIAERRPIDRRSLVGIPGIGAKKLDQYGPDVIAIVKSHVFAGQK